MTQIPDDFLIGVATSAYQVEGAVEEDGRGPSIWDIFSHTRGRTYRGDNGDVACDWYHRYASDIATAREIGLDALRFSIAWPRLFPAGSGKLNDAGLDFYKRLVDTLLEADIQPVATLYHWDLPQWIQEKGGWPHRDTAERFAEYAHTVFHHFGDSIPKYITLNEPWCTTVLGHVYGEHAPGQQNIQAAVATSHNLLLAHGRAVEAFRAENLHQAGIGITNIMTWIRVPHPAPDNDAAARRVSDVMNHWFLDPLFQKRYPDTLRAMGIDALVQPGDWDVIGQPIDFLGVNYYRSTLVEADPSEPLLGAKLMEPGTERTAMGWGVDATGLTELLRTLPETIGNTPIYITENGAAYEDVLGEDGRVHDRHRTEYLQGHLEAALEARASGVDVRGCFIWSLIDNFEWAYGYDKRFGVVHVDFETQQRTWKDSAKWLQGVMQARSLT